MFSIGKSVEIKISHVDGLNTDARPIPEISIFTGQQNKDLLPVDATFTTQ
jgi:hypothetical protein